MMKSSMYWLLKASYWATKSAVAESVMRICFRRRTRNRGEHIRGLEEKVRKQAREICFMQDCAEEHNARAKAMNILVGCDGPCNAAYMDDPSLVDEDVVRLAERNAKRLRHWWDRGGQAAAEAYREKWKR